MKAKVIQEYFGVLAGEIYPHKITVGTELTGEDAHAAVEAGWAEFPEKKPPQNKAQTPPRNKSGSASQAGQASQKNKSKKRETLTLSRSTPTTK